MGWTAQCGSICLFDERLCTGAIARYPSSHKKKKNSTAAAAAAAAAVERFLRRCRGRCKKQWRRQAVNAWAK